MPLLVDDAFATFLDNDSDGRTRGRRDRLVWRTDGKRCLLTFTRSTNLVRCDPSILPTDPSFRRYGKTKGTGGRQTDCCTFPGIPDAHEVRTRVCWPVISMTFSMWSVWAVFSSACVLWFTVEVTPLCGPGAEPVATNDLNAAVS